MAAPFPHEYTVELEGAFPGTLHGGGRPAIVAGPPPEFDGNGEWWSPEHLLVASASLCLATTFRAIAQRARLEVQGYRAHARGTLDKTPEGVRFTRITLAVDLDVADGDRDRALELLQKAKKHCIISNSLAVPVELEAAAPVAAGSRK